MKSLVPTTADRTPQGLILRKKDLLARLLETEAYHAERHNPGAAALFAEMADDVQADILELQAALRNARI